MWVLLADITIGRYSFKAVKEVEINSHTDSIGDTATIHLPLTAVIRGSRINLKQAIKRGDKVVVKLAYDTIDKTEFTGFVTSVYALEYLSIECEDNIFLLRKELPNTVLVNASLKNLLDYIKKHTAIEYNTDTKITWEQYKIQNMTAYGLIQKLKSDHGLAAFFDSNGVLQVGAQYTYKQGSVRYDFTNKDKLAMVKKNDLKYREASEKRFRVKAVSLLPNGKRLTVEFGDKDADLRTITAQGITDKEVLTEFAKKELEKYKYTGYEGTLTSFLLPNVRIGATAELVDTDGNKSQYYVRGVTTRFGSNGAEREVELGIKLN